MFFFSTMAYIEMVLQDTCTMSLALTVSCSSTFDKTRTDSIGVQPAYYRYEARRLLSFYDTVKMENATVTDIKNKGKKGEFTQFSLSVDYPGQPTKQITARKVVLATGLKDILPETPGIAENWGKGIFWCPWCDGHEHEDQPLGLLAPLNKVAGLVREMATLNRDVY